MIAVESDLYLWSAFIISVKQCDFVDYVDRDN